MLSWIAIGIALLAPRQSQHADDINALPEDAVA
jgi:hypothetical protein